MRSRASGDPGSCEWVELGGRVELLRPLRGPLSDAPCVIYRVQLSFWQRLLEGFAGRTGGTSELAGTRFALRRSSGPLVIVDPRCAEIRLHGSAALRRKVCIGDDPALDARLSALYARLGRALPRRGTVVCQERWLRRDDPVWIIGQLLAIPAADGSIGGGYREPPRTVLLRAATLSLA